MPTYKSETTYFNVGTEREECFVSTNIVANGMISAFSSAMDRFAVSPMGIMNIRKVVITLDTRSVTGGIIYKED